MDELVIDAWWDRAMSQVSARKALTAGQHYSVRLWLHGGNFYSSFVIPHSSVFGLLALLLRTGAHSGFMRGFLPGADHFKFLPRIPS